MKRLLSIAQSMGLRQKKSWRKVWRCKSTNYKKITSQILETLVLGSRTPQSGDQIWPKHCYLCTGWTSMWCWVGQVPASQTRNAGQVAFGPNTESAKRRPCAGFSRSIMGSSFLANKFPFPSKRPIRYFQWKKKRKKSCMGGIHKFKTVFTGWGCLGCK